MRVLLNFITELLQSHRVINVVSVILGTLAGLYGFQGILGHRGGVLRQLIVMCPAGITYAVSVYVFNAFSSNYYASVYQGLFSAPSVAAGTTILIIHFFLYGFLVPLTMPNLYRTTEEYDDEIAVPLVIAFVCLQVLSKVISFAVMLQVANLGQKLPFAGHWSTNRVFIASLIYGIISIPAAVKGASVFRIPLASHWPRKWWEYVTHLTPIAGCLLFFVIIIQYFLVFLVILTIGWTMLLFIIVLAALQVILRRLQRMADSLSQRQVTYIALVLLILVAAVQLYQAIFLS